METSLLHSGLFRLHPASIVTMVEFTLSFLILMYFLSLRGKTRDTWLMIVYIGSAMLVYLIDVGVTSSRPPLYNYFRISHAFLFTGWTLFWVWCAYNYQDHRLRRESIIVIVIAGMTLAGIFVKYFLHDPKSDDFFSLIAVYSSCITLYIWTIIVLLRKSIIASRDAVNSSKGTYSLLLNPSTQEALSFRAFALLIFCWVGVFLVSLPDSSFGYHIGQLVLLLGVLIIHVSHAREITTFQAKLIALPLTTVLAILGILPFLLYGTTPPEADWGHSNLNTHSQLLVFVWMIPASTLFILTFFFLFYRIGLLKPLADLMKGIQRIEEGDLQSRLAIPGQDEIGSLSRSFNKMASSLKASKEKLESRVIERTKALQASLDQLKSTQTQLIQREKMASLGELTAGIAHEIQNPLNFVNNFSEVSAEQIEELEEELDLGRIKDAKAIVVDLKENLEKIHRHGRRADAIVRGMLEHARTTPGELSSTDINQLCDEYLMLAYKGQRAKDENFQCEIVTDYGTQLGKVKVVASDIGRVMINLFNNALYALQQRLKENDNAYCPTIWISTQKLDDQVEIRVRDNGVGISPEVVDKIFHPFFTTKPTGEGTGLGLSLSYDIVTKGHAGTMRVESKLGVGAEFVVKL